MANLLSRITSRGKGLIAALALTTALGCASNFRYAHERGVTWMGTEKPTSAPEGMEYVVCRRQIGVQRAPVNHGQAVNGYAPMYQTGWCMAKK